MSGYGCRDQVDAAVVQDVPANLVRLQLHALAYNLGNFLRTLATPEPIKDRALTSLRKKLIKSAPRSSATVATSPSRWPRSLSPSKCSTRYCGSSRNCGRTHRLRQHKTAVSHAFSSNRRKDCVQMPSRTTSSDTQPHLGRLGMAAISRTTPLGFHPVRKTPTIHLS